MTWRRPALPALSTVLMLACVAYDIAGPPVPSLAGTYATTILVRYANYLEMRSDTLLASITLRDTHYRGRFEGTYRTAFGDSGQFAGAERPESTLIVDVFGVPPNPFAHVLGLRQLYPWCDFARIGAGPLLGRLRSDSLLLDGQASVLCFYRINGMALQIGTDLELTIRGVR